MAGLDSAARCTLDPPKGSDALSLDDRRISLDNTAERAGRRAPSGMGVAVWHEVAICGSLTSGR